jgi:hypothetical protein
LTVQASGMNAVPVTVPAVPANAIPLGDVTISGGNWATVTDTRAFLTAMPLIAGNGIVLTQTAGRAQIDVDLGIVPSLAGANVFTGQTVASVATKTAPNRIGTSDPPNCDPSVRETFYNTSTNTLRVCTGTNSWTSANTVSVASTGLGYFLPSGPTSAGAQSASGTSATYFLQFILPFPMSVSSIGLNLAGGGTAGQAAAIAIYDASCNKIAGSDVRQVGLASSGAVFPGLSATITLGPGVYYFGFGTDSSTASFQTAISSTMAALLNQPSNPRVFSGNALTGSGATLSLPASCGSKTAGGWSVPSVALLP